VRHRKGGGGAVGLPKSWVLGERAVDTSKLLITSARVVMPWHP
jgi:hypothetical protein